MPGFLFLVVVACVLVVGLCSLRVACFVWFVGGCCELCMARFVFCVVCYLSCTVCCQLLFIVF